MTKVVDIGKRPEEPPLTVVKADYRECQHKRYEVHGDLPRVFCADCDATLDPFWVLRKIAGDFSMRDYRIRELKRESERMEKLVRRRLEGRRKDHKAESDARAVQSLVRTQTEPVENFNGHVGVTDKAPPDESA